MQLKAILLSALALVSLSASAQDKIYKRNGDVINGKVKEVNQRSVSYKRQDNPDGPDYVINRNEVDRIQYQNGSEDYMTTSPRRDDRAPENSNERARKEKIVYGGNIISAALINLNEHGWGLGLAYERSIDKKGIISFYLPVNVCLGGIGGGQTYDLYGTPSFNSNRRTIWQIMPGVKFYPTGNQGTVRYAVGPQLVYQTGTIQRNDQWVSNPNFPGSGYYMSGDARIEKLGVMINNSLNIFPSAHMFIGMDLGLGLPYSWKEENLNTGDMEERGMDSPLVQFNFRMGFRF